MRHNTNLKELTLKDIRGLVAQAAKWSNSKDVLLDDIYTQNPAIVLGSKCNYSSMILWGRIIVAKGKGDYPHIDYMVYRCQNDEDDYDHIVGYDEFCDELFDWIKSYYQ